MDDTLKLILDKLSSMDSELKDVKGNMFAELRDIKKHLLIIEHEHGMKLDALFDGYKQLYEKQQEHDRRFDEHDRRFDSIEAKLEKQGVEIKVIKGGK